MNVKPKYVYPGRIFLQYFNIKHDDISDKNIQLAFKRALNEFITLANKED